MRVIRRSHWFTTYEWLPDGEIQGDALLDLNTKGNVLSVFELEDGGNLDRTAAALAARRDYLDVLDIALLDEAELERLEIAVRAEHLGETPDDEINQIHRELSELTVVKVSGLAAVVATSEQQRVTRARVKRLVREGISNGWIDTTRVSQTLLEQLAT